MEPHRYRRPGRWGELADHATANFVPVDVVVPAPAPAPAIVDGVVFQLLVLLCATEVNNTAGSLPLSKVTCVEDRVFCARRPPRV